MHFAFCVFLCCCTSGCANRFQHAADKSLLIQENLQLDQALSITQYELMRAQQDNDALRRQLEQAQNAGNGTTGDRMPPLRSEYEPVSGTEAYPAFDANHPNLPPPSNQVPQRFQRPQQDLPPEIPPQSSAAQYVDTPPGAPQWSPYR
ncbi:MAG: hypothetical protein FWH27_05455 [Planctomycetaceae bacterium]|nr:hypothetical protein [Planctomycetaceae bacterium]